MIKTDGQLRSPRTELECQIRQRKQTFEEFAAYVESFAREHGEPGTLSVRHLQRLAAGRHQTVRPATGRLLEHILGRNIQELLAPPAADRPAAIPQPLRVAIAVVTKDDQVLLVRRRTDHNGLTWQFPAGIVKPGEDAKMVAIQETLAETGIHCIITRLLGNRIHPATGADCEYFQCRYVVGEIQNLDRMENLDVAWIAQSLASSLIGRCGLYAPVLSVLTAGALD